MTEMRWNDDWSQKYTGVKPNSPSGSVLRRYWHPLIVSTELPPRNVCPVELLGEELVLFRLADGTVGVLPRHCQHRGASLLYGFVEHDGIRCAYHGWKFSPEGALIDAPFGACNTHDGRPVRVNWRAKAYECGGIIFVCLEPSQPELLPRWDILLTGSEEIIVQRHEVNCNWFQYQENAADLTHTLFLHGAWMKALGIPDSSGFHAQLNWYAFANHPFGIVKAWRYEGREVGWGNLAVFPNILRIVEEMHWRVPLDAERTLIFQVSGRRVSSGPRVSDRLTISEPLPAVSAESPPIYFDKDVNERRFRLWSFQGQDAAACVTQGPQANRRKERLVTSDFGVELYRKAWQKFCDSKVGPAAAYANLGRDHESLDLRPWLGFGDVTVSRPVDVTSFGNELCWSDIFGGQEYLIPVPRGSVGRGPLG